MTPSVSSGPNTRPSIPKVATPPINAMRIKSPFIWERPAMSKGRTMLSELLTPKIPPANMTMPRTVSPDVSSRMPAGT